MRGPFVRYNVIVIGFCFLLIAGCLISLAVTLAAAQHPTPPHYVVTVNAYGVPIYCWQAVAQPSGTNVGTTFKLADGSKVYVSHAIISTNPEAVGIDPDRCTDGRYNVIGSTAAALR